MRIATLQFNPQVGAVEENIRNADDLLAKGGLLGKGKGKVDLLVLPEMAFSGYSFPSLAAIEPYLEPTAAGPSTAWAKRTARRLGCVVCVGYPEIATLESAATTRSSGRQQQQQPLRSVPAAASNGNGDNHALTEEELPTNVHPDQEWPIESNIEARNGVVDSIKRYNSTVTVSSTGEILAHYRKTHLYHTDESWATASPSRFLTTKLPLPAPSSSFSSISSRRSTSLDDGEAAVSTIHHSPVSNTTDRRQTKTTFGICMDLNPLAFAAPWPSYELATHTLSLSSELLIVSMAWCTHAPADLPSNPSDIHLESLSYWVARLKPLLDAEKETVIVMANRCGVEEGEVGKDAVHYVGSSWIGKMGNGEVKIWGMLGCKEEGVLVVDTDEAPSFRMVSKRE